MTFAIRIRPETLPKISDRFPDIPADVIAEIDSKYSHRSYYFISGYVTRLGHFEDWTILPEYVIERSYEFNPQVIQTDWDQIVRTS